MAGRCGVGKGEEIRVKGHCYVHKCLQCQIRDLLESFSHFYNASDSRYNLNLVCKALFRVKTLVEQFI